MTEAEPRVFVVDDDEAMCEALQWLLESEGLPVETYHSAEAFLETYHPRQPGCLVLDVRMRGMSGLDLQAYLAQKELGIPIIIITAHGDVPMAVRAVQGGAVDFLEKPVSDQVLLKRIRHALEIDAQARQELRQRADTAARLETLTPREREVMDLVTAGKASKHIATVLGIAEKTVEVHRKRVMHKMGVHNAVDLVRLVIADGEHADNLG